MPIGNLTSQIFANVYLNELDRFVKHSLKPLRYLRYGDDFILIARKKEELEVFRVATVDFLENTLKLELNPKNNKIIKVRHGLRFLGVIIWSCGRKPNKRSFGRIQTMLNSKNVASYRGLLGQHSNKKKMKEFHWSVLEKHAIIVTTSSNAINAQNSRDHVNAASG